MRTIRLLLLALLMTGHTGPSFAQFAVSVVIAPPALPVYVQPVAPDAGYLWTPGYWAYGGEGYFWVPGTWVQPPTVGLLWTPGYWGWGGNAFAWNGGYWGRRSASTAASTTAMAMAVSAIKADAGRMDSFTTTARRTT